MEVLKVTSGDESLEITVEVPQPKKLIVNGPATVILWDDGSKTVAKCNKDEPFDPEKGVAIAIAKRFVSSGKLHKLFDDARFQEIDDNGMRSMLEQWRENMRMLAKLYGSNAGGEKK